MQNLLRQRRLKSIFLIPYEGVLEKKAEYTSLFHAPYEGFLYNLHGHKEILPYQCSLNSGLPGTVSQLPKTERNSLTYVPSVVWYMFRDRLKRAGLYQKHKQGER